MANGMYCSASHWIDSVSSSAVMTGREILLMITACPDSAVATCVFLIRWLRKSLWMVSITRPESMMAPSTIASDESDSQARFRSW